MRAGCGRLRHIDLKLLWVQEATKKLGLRVYKVAGELNRANIGTKPLNGADIVRERRMSGLLSEQEVGKQLLASVYAVTETAPTRGMEERIGAALHEVSELARLIGLGAAK